ncbi:hypothetical protein ACQ3I4_14470 [Zafaria sp. Z1313]|uniref:hypothetical protein n=1 Tax=Zafaria sp. Z1313 TaxID=3423202 RepID=UPI003D3039E7
MNEGQNAPDSAPSPVDAPGPRTQELAHHRDTYLFEADADVVATGTDAAGPWAALSPNIFHPRGGGQPDDAASVDGAPVELFKHDAGWVAFRPRPAEGTDSPAEGEVPPPGTRVRAAVDPETRLLHAALHTAGHLIGFVGESVNGWSYTGHSHFPGQARLDFAPDGLQERFATEELRAGELAAFQARLDALIAGAGAVTATTAADGRRTVEIAGVGSEPCGGTHVDHVDRLAAVTVTEMRIKRGTLKVKYTASHRPL